ncbi:hydrolase [Amylibacter marinus]|uniref:Hydrolase n=1 Tax=Amylibacter marinus TaxID=1475483 RepID=A0ABQ5VUY0_9RHOB|nr:hydrolase [Amylibacter marinus]
MGIIDAHVHVFEPKKFPYATKRNYTPGEATAENLRNHMLRIGADKVVIVQPSPYGADNQATVQAVEILGQDVARAIAVIDPERTAPEFVSSLWHSGVRGVRANLKTSGQTGIDTARRQLEQLADRLSGTDMALQIFLPADVIVELKDTIRGLGRLTILDHFAGLKIGDPNFSSTLDGLQEVLVLPNVVLKVSGSVRATDYADTPVAMEPFIPALFDAAKDRIVWGSDWPHTGKSSERAARPLSEIEPFMEIDDAKSLGYIREWCRSEAEFRNITYGTSKEIYGF